MLNVMIIVLHLIVSSLMMLFILLHAGRGGVADLVGPAGPVQPAGAVPDGVHRHPVVLGEDPPVPEASERLGPAELVERTLRF